LSVGPTRVFSFATAIHRAGTIRVTTADGKPPLPVAEQALRRSQIKPLPKRRDAAAGAAAAAASSSAAQEEPQAQVSMVDWMDTIAVGRLPEGVTEQQAQMVRQYHSRLRKD
jgi:hypothetical protein